MYGLLIRKLYDFMIYSIAIPKEKNIVRNIFKMFFYMNEYNCLHYVTGYN